MRSRVALTALAAVIAGSLAGCGDGDQEGDDSHADPSAPTAQHDEDAARFFDDAVTRLVKADTGRFHQDLAIGPAGMTMEGAYELSSQSSRVLVTSTSPEGSVTFEILSSPEDRWVRFVDTGFVKDAKCWIHTEAADLSQQLGIEFPAGASLGLPAAVLVPVNGAGDRWMEDGTVLRGATDLYTLAGTFGKLLESLDIDFENTDVGQVDYLFEDGRLTGWRSSLFQLIEGMNAAGIEIPEQLEQIGEQVHAIEVEASLSDAGSAVSTRAPDPRRVIEMEPGMSEQAFDDAFRACQADV